MLNTVELIEHAGSDEGIALSAWTSTSRELTDNKRQRIPSLLKFLAENHHETPFEKSYLRFLVTCDMATHIHIIKHRIAVSVNGESARYKELKDDKYYIPDDWPVWAQETLIAHTETSLNLYHYILNKLQDDGFSRKRAKESARFFLPYNNQLTIDVSFNFRSFIHFLNLRNKPDAQLEIREIAQKMLDLVRETGKFRYALEAFGYDKQILEEISAQKG